MSETTKPKRATKKKAADPVEAEAVVPQVVVRKLPSAVSYSKLTTYDRCSELYKLKYVQGIPESREDTVATRLGGICHTALEVFYEDGGVNVATPYDALVGEGGVWEKELADSGISVLKRELQTYAHHMTKLYWRANAQYTGADKIRKADGTPSVAPQMTGVWKQYVKANRLDELARHIDTVAARVSKRWQGISLSEVYATTLGITYPYKNPREIQAVVAIELPISEILMQAANADGSPMVDADGNAIGTSRARGPHPVYIDPVTGKGVLVDIQHEFYLPALGPDGKIAKDSDGNVIFRDDVLFNGYLDMIARDADGKLYIIDHKTSKECPTETKVARHEQLLAYGFIIHHLFGETPDYICINSLRTGVLVKAKFDLDRAEKAMERLAAIVDSIEKKAFVKKDPDAYMTMCVIKSFRDGEPPNLCPGLKYCHPDVYKQYAMADMNLDF